jgi:hypothetical protein
MKRVIVLGVFVLTACGGGGGGNTAPPTPAPTPTPHPIANTSSPFYLPLSTGNSWTFATGGKIVDTGSMTLSCSCPDNGGTMERLAVYSPGSSSVSDSLFFTKNTPSGGTQLTNMIGVENDAGTNNITIASTVQFPYGIPVMDDSPKANETWSDGVGDASTITSVGGTMVLPNGDQVINIAVDQITGNFNPITWAFAKGVGFTSIGAGAQSTTLTSFYVNAATSYAKARHSVRTAHGSPGRPDIGRSLSALFKSENWHN